MYVPLMIALLGTHDDLATALAIIKDVGSSLELHLNTSKSLLYIHKDMDTSHSPLSTEVPITHREFSHS